MGIIMIKCPETGHTVSTGIEAEEKEFRHAAVFFARTLCPMCRTYHEWFARDAWIETS